MLRIAILASGKGSNLQAIIDYIKSEKIAVNPVIVLSDNPDSLSLKIAKTEDINHLCIPEKKHKTFLSASTEKEYVNVLKEHQVDIICLAGFLRVLKKNFIESFQGRIINIHPSLLPAFPGLEAWKQAIDYGVRFTGCTTHFVGTEIDAGPIIMQAVVPLIKGDTPETLHHRIQEKEHVIYPMTIRLMAEGKVNLSGRKVSIARF